jgi:hypothetical protein
MVRFVCKFTAQFPFNQGSFSNGIVPGTPTKTATKIISTANPADEAVAGAYSLVGRAAQGRN